MLLLCVPTIACHTVPTPASEWRKSSLVILTVNPADQATGTKDCAPEREPDNLVQAWVV